MQNQKTAQLANFELDMTAKQSELKESIALELKKQFETRKHEFGEEVKVKDLADMATAVCETKLKEFNQQLLDHVNQIKMVADLGILVIILLKYIILIFNPYDGTMTGVSFGIYIVVRVKIINKNSKF